MIRNIVFDIGSVLKGWNPNTKWFCDEEVSKAVESAIWGSGLWNEFDRGVTPVEEIISKMKSLAVGHEKEIDYVLSHLDMISIRFDYSVPWVKELKAMGYNVYFLSNFSKLMREQSARTLDFLNFMDGGIFSYEVKVLKPDREIYRIFCEKFSLVPNECIFIDDRQANVDAGEKFGMKALLFENFEDCRKKLLDILKSEGVTA